MWFEKGNNLNFENFQGMTALINSIVLEQYVNSNFPLSRSDQDTTHHPGTEFFMFYDGCVNTHKNETAIQLARIEKNLKA